MTYRELREKGKAVLQAADVPDFDYDAGVLLREASGLDLAGLAMRLSEEAPDDASGRYLEMIKERAGRKPLQHIVGTAWFMGLPFRVCSDVLCPRQDTEVLAEAALTRSERIMDARNRAGGLQLQRELDCAALPLSPYHCHAQISGEGQADKEAVSTAPSAGRLLDLCTGSGCLAVSLASLGSFDAVVATDLSEAALAVARKNADLNGCVVEFRQGDLFAPIGRDERFDIIVCNPPYIPSGELIDLMPEVRDYEPSAALDGGDDGLCFYRRLAKGLWRHLVPEGAFFLECGAGQSGEVIRLLMAEGRYEGICVTRDLAGHDRVVSGRRMA